MDVFIVSPFGTKKVLQKDQTGKQEVVDFDFKRVHEELIEPALQQLHLEGGTTGKIFEAGSIHEDMFSLLLVADIVIADISIHNANVFYELGIRHALRDKRTVLIKCPGFDETPFDIIGYRYITYNKDDPGAAVGDLVQALEETRLASKKDSPVFDKLSHLESQDPERFLAVPKDFESEVTLVKGDAAKLAMMATEISGFPWYIPGLRQIGEALYDLRCLESARTVWEKVKKYRSNDLQANERLATIYQRLAEAEIKADSSQSTFLFDSSDLAIRQLLAQSDALSPWKRAEAYALKARNAKTLWVESWKRLPAEDRPAAAIGSRYLETAFETYERGFLECLNHYYAGINALGLLLTTITLAEQYFGIWELHWNSSELARQQLEALKKKLEVLKLSVQLSIEAGKKTIHPESGESVWLRITEADLICLTETRPARVKLTYQHVLKGASNLNFDATVRQLLLYGQLGIAQDNIKAALEALPALSAEASKPKNYYLLFTGHMIDRPDRSEPRFPAKLEPQVKIAITEKVRLEKERVEKENEVLIGLAGGGSGGDILFHEVCAELGIKTRLFLALPRDQFVAESVAFAGPGWTDRFDQLYNRLPVEVLAQSRELPNWLKKKKDYTIWERNNLWMLHQALENGGQYMSLIALWNGKGGDGPGGTAHMVREAKDRGARTIPISINGTQVDGNPE